MELPNEASERSKKPTLLLAEASQMDCQLLADAIERQGQFRVLGCVFSSAGVISAIREIQPDVALISGRLVDGICAGLRAINQLQASRTSLRIVVLLDSEDRELVVESFRCGAKGVVNRSASPKELWKCIASVYAGQIWASNNEVKYLVEALAETPRATSINPKRIELLSKREGEVAQLAVIGLTNREISQHLNLNEHTVKNYLSHIFEKLAVSSRIELIHSLSLESTAAG
jgi:DNA-binding NarL/FixJ family response regulator